MTVIDTVIWGEIGPAGIDPLLCPAGTFPVLVVAGDTDAPVVDAEFQDAIVRNQEAGFGRLEAAAAAAGAWEQDHRRMGVSLKSHPV